jgi:hypothetical protein
MSEDCKEVILSSINISDVMAFIQLLFCKDKTVVFTNPIKEEGEK